MTQFALASMTICAPVAAATSGRTRLVRRGAADARADAIVAKSARKTRITLPVGRGAARDVTRRRGSAVVAAGGVGVFGDDADAVRSSAGEDDAAAFDALAAASSTFDL